MSMCQPGKFKAQSEYFETPQHRKSELIFSGLALIVMAVLEVLKTA